MTTTEKNGAKYVPWAAVGLIALIMGGAFAAQIEAAKARQAVILEKLSSTTQLLLRIDAENQKEHEQIKRDLSDLKGLVSNGRAK